jgi:phage terminase large subunit-like protein
LTWCAANVVVEMDPAGKIKPSRRKTGEKIDSIVALAMDLGRIMAEPAPYRSIYETEGLFVV